eukprot:64517-Pleurochrysis_carterae.AAC.3
MDRKKTRQKRVPSCARIATRLFRELGSNGQDRTGTGQGRAGSAASTALENEIDASTERIAKRRGARGAWCLTFHRRMTLIVSATSFPVMSGWTPRRLCRVHRSRV